MNIKTLKNILDYDPISGDFTWKETNSKRVKIGDIAGTTLNCLSGKKYRQIYVHGKFYRAHRLAWLFMYGEFPIEHIDHIDGNGLNNKIGNLRAVTQAENNKNRRRPSNNKSGITGIHWVENRNKWQSQIISSGRNKHLGYFKTLLAASYARHIAEIQDNYHPNHGQVRAL